MNQLMKILKKVEQLQNNLKYIITVKESKNILNECPNDWTITLMKWEHGTEEDFKRKYPRYPTPNRVSVCIQDIQYRKTDDGDVIYKIILDEDFDYYFTC